LPTFRLLVAFCRVWFSRCPSTQVEYRKKKTSSYLHFRTHFDENRKPRSRSGSGSGLGGPGAVAGAGAGVAASAGAGAGGAGAEAKAESKAS
jgi:hypothetical protein